MPFVEGCPFGGRSSDKAANAAQAVLRDSNSAPPALPVGKARIQLLYEEYIHLPQLRAVWDSPVTSEPVLEPCFAAGMHGIELGFLLLAEFLSDDRSYVAKQPRIERVAADIEQQCRLLTEVIDGELEEEDTATNRLSLTQSFPFPGAPPTSACPGHSPGLQHFEAAARSKFPTMLLPERNSLVKVVINLTAAFASFQRWSVGVGIEPQLDSLRAAVGLPPVPSFLPHAAAWLDYGALVRPQVTDETLTGCSYTHAEDFFFRTVHLGTECWARVALARLRSAADHAACAHWHVAASRTLQASRILDYLGDHVLLLTSMNLRDYLLLKVELEGTSGEGSTQVRALRQLVASLLDPLAQAVAHLPPTATSAAHPGPGQVKCPEPLLAANVAGEATAQQDLTEEEGRALQLGSALMEVYEFPDRHREFYNYAKSLEGVESALLGGFYFKHFLLAANVIGSDARGTMRRSVAALKATYERPVFPVLDRVRSGLGAKVDAELAPVKGKMMAEILDAYLRRPSSPSSPAPSRSASRQQQAAVDSDQRRACLADARGKRGGEGGPEEAGQIGALQRLYSWDGVPSDFRRELVARMRHFSRRLNLTPHAGRGGGAGSATPLAFLDHAWGAICPRAMHAALVDLAALHQLGNPAWDELFAAVVPQASAHVRELLEIPPHRGSGGGDDSGVVVHWGHNSHELVFALLSERLMPRRQLSSGGEARPLRVLTSDCEFYSIQRQLNRLAEDGAVGVQAVSADPAATFAERCAAAAAAAAADGHPFDVIYVSQVTYLSQQTLLTDVPAFVAAVTTLHQGQQLVIIDGYHAFCAFPTALGPAAESCCYIGGLLKHAGCGANCAFITVPRRLTPRPVCTGWLADPSVLAAGSDGVGVGSKVEYAREAALQGGTPAFLLPLLTFNHLMVAWAEGAVTVPALHGHVLCLHQRLLDGLPPSGDPGISLQTLLPPQPPEVRSHTLVFVQPSADDAKAVVEQLARQGVLVDSRKRHVRVGFGPNHTGADVDALLAAVCGK